jgi:uncharacterized protein (TIGR03086 family)
MTDPIGRLAAEAIQLLIDAVEQTPPEAWNQPSNLEDWNVGQVVGHATGSAAKIVTLVEGGEIWSGPSQPADWMSEDPAGRLREFTERLGEALPRADWDVIVPAPEGEVPLRRALIFPVADLALHSWDVHRSQRRSIELPEELIALCCGLIDSLPESLMRRPGAFGPAKPAPTDATPTIRLMAHLGRKVDPV